MPKAQIALWMAVGMSAGCSQVNVIQDSGEGAIHAPAETWSFAPVQGAVCADGSATGVGLNPKPTSTDLVIYLQGGGACWDWNSCWGLLPSASHIAGGYKASDFEVEPNLTSLLYLERGSSVNPFRDANLAFVPYCTGDLHAGNRLQTYSTSQVTHHVGAQNLSVMLGRLTATFPEVNRVFLVGASAGGFGVALNLENVAAKFAPAPVHGLDDSGPMISPAGDLWSQWQETWGVQFPPTCPGCANQPASLLSDIAQNEPGSRFGLLSNTSDGVISSYANLSGTQFNTELTALVSGMNATPSERAFLISGGGHVVASDPQARAGSTSLGDWLASFASGADFQSAGP